MTSTFKGLLLCAAAGCACSVVYAGPKTPRPSGGPVAKAPQSPRFVSPQKLSAARRLDPIAYVKIRTTPDGRTYATGPLMPYVGRVVDDPTESAFDLFGADALGLPVGGDACAGLDPDSRYWGGAGYLNANIVNDFQVAAGSVNKPLGRIDFAWNWGPGALRPMWVVLQVFDTFNDCGGAAPASTFIDGIAFQFADDAGSTAGYYFANIGLAPDPATNVLMPADGNGAYQITLGEFVQATNTVVLDGAIGTQPMLWGIMPGAAGIHANGREYDDDGGLVGPNVSDGVINTAAGATGTPGECYDYTGAVPCPELLGGIIGMWVEPGGSTPSCYANCDQSTNAPCLNVLDFSCFLNQFAAGASYANCDNSTNPPVLNVLDFSCFLNTFAAGCSGC